MNAEEIAKQHQLQFLQGRIDRAEDSIAKKEALCAMADGHLKQYKDTITRFTAAVEDVREIRRIEREGIEQERAELRRLYDQRDAVQAGVGGGENIDNGCSFRDDLDSQLSSLGQAEGRNVRFGSPVLFDGDHQDHLDLHRHAAGLGPEPWADEDET
ncbi:hypothetical protein CF319_g4690 [Tilletia indica]|uniref:Uncharacterized protein n=1 Tax=Tilletia indica TaxID=43049 RepID=A0A177TEV3_9BASI|nr:hypothetical protein CF319_g4690 [Tilletia indica]KAE8228152.1 hypothetical protein CF326_g6928 [Tilletia indica]KAE8255408.1 hypothetical protein A4X13_0g3057 [Tilletia indica]